MTSALVTRKSGQRAPAGPLDLHRAKEVLPSYTQLVVGALIRMADNKTWQCRRAAATIADTAGMCRKTFFIHLQYLEHLGLVKVKREFWAVSRYEIDAAAMLRLEKAVLQSPPPVPPKAQKHRRRGPGLGGMIDYLKSVASSAAEAVGLASSGPEFEAAELAREILGEDLADELGCTAERLRRQWRQNKESLDVWRAGWEGIRASMHLRRGRDLVRLWSRTSWKWHVARTKVLLAGGDRARQGIMRYTPRERTPAEEAAHLAEQRRLLVIVAEMLGSRESLDAFDAEHPELAELR